MLIVHFRLLKIRVFVGLCMLQLHHRWLRDLVVNIFLLLLLLWSNLEQIIVFFVDVAYLPVMTLHHLRVVVVTLHSAVL
jgi:hypothetical protein